MPRSIATTSAELSLGKFGTVFRDGTLLLKVQKMPSVRRECLDQVDCDWMVDDIAPAREVARRPAIGAVTRTSSALTNAVGAMR